MHSPMQSTRASHHKWTDEDHLVAFYLYKFSDKGLKYSREELAEKMGMGVNSLSLRIRNYAAVDGAGGLDNGSKAVLQIYKLYNDTPQPALKAVVERIIARLS